MLRWARLATIASRKSCNTQSSVSSEPCQLRVDASQSNYVRYSAISNALLGHIGSDILKERTVWTELGERLESGSDYSMIPHYSGSTVV